MFDITKSHDEVVAVLASDISLAEGMARLIDFCADQESWRGWLALRQLDFAADERRLKRWLVGVLTKEPPQKSVKAYWFGIFNPIVEDKATCGMYLAGSKIFDAADETFDWACGPDYFPNGRYAESQVLDEIYRKVDKAKGSVSEYGEYVLCLGFGGLIIKTLANTIDVETWLGNLNSRAVAIGFDSGVGILMGSITKNGWQPITPKIG